MKDRPLRRAASKQAQTNYAHRHDKEEEEEHKNKRHRTVRPTMPKTAPAMQKLSQLFFQKYDKILLKIRLILVSHKINLVSKYQKINNLILKKKHCHPRVSM